MPEELWLQVSDIVQEAVIKAIPPKEKCKKAKWLSEEALQIAEKRREAKGKGEKERYIHLNAESHSPSLLPTNPGGQTLVKLGVPGRGVSGLSRWDLYEILSPFA